MFIHWEPIFFIEIERQLKIVKRYNLYKHAHINQKTFLTHRDPAECLKDPVLWLSLASLCVLDKDHVDSLSSGEWNGEATASRPTCDNHDDGETLAIILCDHCGNLCADCDR